MCPVHSETGKCRHGFKCRFLGAHVEAAGDGISDESSLIIDGEKAAHAAVSAAELNFVDPDVRKQLRTRKVTTFYSPSRWNSVDSMCSGIARLRLTYAQYPRPVSDAYLKEIQQSLYTKDEETLELSEEAEVYPSGAGFEASRPSISQDVGMSQNDTPDTPTRFVEKMRLHWSGKTCKWIRSVEQIWQP